MWLQADQTNIILEPMTDYGWSIIDDNLRVVWDSDKNRQAVRNRIENLLKGCKCKTGCIALTYKCKNNKSTCKEGCECRNCENIKTTTQTEWHVDFPTDTQYLHGMEVRDEIECDDMIKLIGALTMTLVTYTRIRQCKRKY